MLCIAGELCGGDDGDTATDDRLSLPAIHQQLWHADRPVGLPDGDPDRHWGAGNDRRLSTRLEWNDSVTELVRICHMTISDVKRGQNLEAEARATRPRPRPVYEVEAEAKTNYEKSTK